MTLISSESNVPDNTPKGPRPKWLRPEMSEDSIRSCIKKMPVAQRRGFSLFFGTVENPTNIEALVKASSNYLSNRDSYAAPKKVVRSKKWQNDLFTAMRQIPSTVQGPRPSS